MTLLITPKASVQACCISSVQASPATSAAVWSLDGHEVYRFAPSRWSGGDEGTYWVSLGDESGLAPGSSQVEVLFDGTVAASGSVTVGRGGGF